MNKQFYFLSPVEVVKVSSQNLEEVAEWCGGSVQETESRRVPGRMDKYVLVPTPKDTNISWAFPGMFITKRLVVTVKDELRGTFAVFRRDYFEKNYFDTPKDAADKTWEREAAEKSKPAKKNDVKVANNLGEALVEAQKKVRLDNLYKDGEITVEPVKSGPLTDEENAELDELQKIVHNHKAQDRCDENDCEVDRYTDGRHVFTDCVIDADIQGENVVLNSSLTIPLPKREPAEVDEAFKPAGEGVTQATTV